MDFIIVGPGPTKVEVQAPNEGEIGPWGGIRESRPQHVNKLRDIRRRKREGPGWGGPPREAEGRMGGQPPKARRWRHRDARWLRQERPGDVPGAERRRGGRPRGRGAEGCAGAFISSSLFPGEIRASENSYFCQAARQLASVPSSQLCVKLASGGDPTYAFNIRFTGEEVHGTSKWQPSRLSSATPGWGPCLGCKSPCG